MVEYDLTCFAIGILPTYFSTVGDSIVAEIINAMGIKEAAHHDGARVTASRDYIHVCHVCGSDFNFPLPNVSYRQPKFSTCAGPCLSECEC